MDSTTRTAVGADISFLLDSGEEGLVARGVHRRFADIPTGSNLRELLGEGSTIPLPQGFEGGRSGEASPEVSLPPAVVVGALPFDPKDAPVLVQPLEWCRVASHRTPEDWRTTIAPVAVPGAEMQVLGACSIAFSAMVRRALDEMAASRAGSSEPLSKVVLARRLTVRADRPFDPAAVVELLRRDPHASVFLVRLPVEEGMGAEGGERFFAGATPELLLEKRGMQVRSMPMAGSAPRNVDSTADRETASTLLRSVKDLREHALVVEQVLDTLAPVCRKLSAPATPEVVGAGSVWHLATPVEGELNRSDISSLDLARALHPTPAVCGVPTEAARKLITELEPFHRDFYAGAVGWCDATGDGRWMVSIRCAEFQGSTAMLYAGAGIVEDSVPQAEAAETSAKFLALLRAIGIREDGSPLGEAT